MARFLTLASLALLTIAEIAAVLALYNWVGPALALAVLGLDMLAGLLVMRWALTSPAGADRGWKVAGGAFIALPGLVLDLVGLALLLPPTRSWLKRVLQRNVAAAAARSGVSVITVTGPDGSPATAVVPGEVIVGEVVQVDPQAGPPPGAAGRNEPQPPRIIAGELAGPQDSVENPS